MKKFDKVTRIIYTIVYGVATLAIFLFWKFFVKNTQIFRLNAGLLILV